MSLDHTGNHVRDTTTFPATRGVSNQGHLLPSLPNDYEGERYPLAGTLPSIQL